MSDTGYAKGLCQRCGGHLEFPTTGLGLTVDCPHCGGQTTLISGPPDIAASDGKSPARPGSKAPVLWGLAVLILILAAASVAFHWFNQTGTTPPAATMAAPSPVTNSEVPPAPSPAPEANDLMVAGPVRLQKTEGSGLVYAVGTVKNNSDRQRFGVRIELDLLDEQDNKIGTAGDYIAVLEPHKDWPFRALLTQPKAVKAMVAKIEEQK
jgi:hypothetical protein